MAAKFVLKKGSTGKFRFNPVATNGQVIATSEAYESKRAQSTASSRSSATPPTLRSTTRPTSSLLVRAGSVRHGKPLVLGGHERSVSANENRSSHGLHRPDLRRQNSLVPGSSPSSGTPKLRHLTSAGDGVAPSSAWNNPPSTCSAFLWSQDDLPAWQRSAAEDGQPWR